MPRADFTSARHKLDRAHHHLNSLNAEISAWFETDPLTVEIGSMFFPFDAALPRQVRFDIEDIGPVPPAISLTLGDALTNLRGALDHVAWSVVTASRDWPPPGKEPRIYFPISKTFKRFRESPLYSFAPYRVRLAIQRHQPYHRRYTPHLHPLSLLNRLVNDDKHKSLHPMLTALHEIPPEISATIGRIERVKHRPRTRLEKSATIATVWVQAGRGVSDVDVDRVAVQITFDESDPVRLPVLHAIPEEVTAVIADCEDAYL